MCNLILTKVFLKAFVGKIVLELDPILWRNQNLLRVLLLLEAFWKVRLKITKTDKDLHLESW